MKISIKRKFYLLSIILKTKSTICRMCFKCKIFNTDVDQLMKFNNLMLYIEVQERWNEIEESAHIKFFHPPATLSDALQL